MIIIIPPEALLPQLVEAKQQKKIIAKRVGLRTNGNHSGFIHHYSYSYACRPSAMELLYRVTHVVSTYNVVPRVSLNDED